MSNDKDEVSPERKEELKDESAKRVQDGKSSAVSNMNTVFGNDAENEVRTEAFEHSKEVERDAITENNVKQKAEDED